MNETANLIVCSRVISINCACRILWHSLLLRLCEPLNALQLPVFFSFFFSCFASVIRNIGKFGAKNYFTDHRTANAIHGFKD